MQYDPSDDTAPDDDGQPDRALSRRRLVQALGVGAGVIAVGAKAALAQTGPMAPPSTVTTPPRDFGPNGAPTTYFSGPGRHRRRSGVQRPCASPTAPIQRLWTGALWVGGPGLERAGPLSGLERHPEQPADALARGRRPRQRVPPAVEQQQRQHLRLPGPAALLRAPDPAGRALRARRLGHVLADSFEGKRLNSPNDVVAHPDGSYWFTDPPYGGQLYEGAPDAAGGPSNPPGQLNPRLGQPAGVGNGQARAADQRATASTPAGASTSSSPRTRCPIPNGLCFSPDYKRLYVASTGKGPGDTGPGGKGDIYVFDVGSDNKLSNRQALHRLHDRRRQVRPRRPALRRRRQSLGVEQCRPRRRLQRRHRLDPDGQADRPHPPAGGRAATSPSAAPSATGCSWPRASRSTPSTSAPRAPRRAKPYITWTPASLLAGMEAPGCGRLLFSTDGLLCTRSM